MPLVDIFPILLTIVALLLNSFHRWMFVQLFSTMHTGETFLGSPKLWACFAWGDRSKTYFSRGKYFKTPAQCKSAGKKALGNCVTHKVWGLNHVLTGSLFTQLSLWGACLCVKPKTWNGTKVNNYLDINLLNRTHGLKDWQEWAWGASHKAGADLLLLNCWNKATLPQLITYDLLFVETRWQGKEWFGSTWRQR